LTREEGSETFFNSVQRVMERNTANLENGKGQVGREGGKKRVSHQGDQEGGGKGTKLGCNTRGTHLVKTLSKIEPKKGKKIG